MRVTCMCEWSFTSQKPDLPSCCKHHAFWKSPFHRPSCMKCVEWCTCIYISALNERAVLHHKLPRIQNRICLKALHLPAPNELWKYGSQELGWVQLHVSVLCTVGELCAMGVNGDHVPSLRIHYRNFSFLATGLACFHAKGLDLQYMVAEHCCTGTRLACIISGIRVFIIQNCLLNANVLT